MTKKIALAFALAAFVALALPSIASANFAIHGSYVKDTDACAGCHRAHTSVSTVTWVDDAVGDEHNALLTTSSTKMYEFCYGCHGADAQGAETNVQWGIYDGTAFGSEDTTLNGGGFERIGGTTTITSKHIFNGQSWGAYGGGWFGQGATGATGRPQEISASQNEGESDQIKMDCASCHDPHGSSNYRILKEMVYGNPVGGYVNIGDPNNPEPDGYVSSTETGWPNAGFRKHDLGAAQVASYIPNYTEAKYAKGYDMRTGAVNRDKGMSGWCAGCHATYNTEVTTITSSAGVDYQTSTWLYQAGDAQGYKQRHMHPMNVELSTYKGADAASMIVTDLPIPLAHDLVAEKGALTETGVKNDTNDWVECLTCHRAHGTAAQMSGYALDPEAYGLPAFPSAGDGQPSALLRLDNRGVCESCHNK